MFELWILSHVVAVAVTEEVSLTAVPAKTENPLLDSPIKSPSVGNISAAKMLNKKITEIAFAISSSSALMRALPLPEAGFIRGRIRLVEK